MADSIPLAAGFLDFRVWPQSAVQTELIISSTSTAAALGQRPHRRRVSAGNLQPTEAPQCCKRFLQMGPACWQQGRLDKPVNCVRCPLAQPVCPAPPARRACPAGHWPNGAGAGAWPIPISAAINRFSLIGMVQFTASRPTRMPSQTLFQDPFAGARQKIRGARATKAMFRR